MKLTKILRFSLNLLLHSKLRSWLTIIGIVIGVAAVVGIISVGQGLQQNVQSQISGLGQDLLTISSGSSRAAGGFRFEGGGGGGATNVKELSERDLQALKLVPGISSMTGIVRGSTKVYYNGETASMSVQGMDVSHFSDFVTAPLESGNYLSQGEARSVVIGYNVAHQTFSKELQVGYIITINGTPFRIAGILSTSSGFGGSDNTIYMSDKDARDVLTLDLASNEFSSIEVKVADVNFIQDTSNSIESVLLNSHHVTKAKEDFTITSAIALQQRFSSVTGALTIFLGVLASISLLVGGIGVANTMFTSVLERTRDIGVMKAIGAKNRDILLVFLLNSGMLGLLGGILGVVLGAIVAYFLPMLGLSLGPVSRGGLSTVISPNLLIFALGFSVAIGMISGAIPAYHASKLKPIEALRYE